MKNLITILALVAVGCLTIAADNGQSGGCANSGVHGELSTGATVNPTNPSDVNVNIGGKIVFAHRPLTPTEKAQIVKEAHDLGVTYASSGSAADVSHAKYNLCRRLAYRYRVVPSKIKPISDAAFDEGFASSRP